MPGDTAALLDKLADKAAAHLRISGQRLGHQFLQIQHLRSVVPQHLRKGIVLLLCRLQIGNIVKQQPFQFAGYQLLQLRPRTVQQHLLQRSRFTSDTNRHRLLPVFSVSFFYCIGFPENRWDIPAWFCGILTWISPQQRKTSAAEVFRGGRFFSFSQPHRVVNMGITCFLRDMTPGKNTVLSFGSTAKALRMASSLPINSSCVPSCSTSVSIRITIS